MPTASRSPTAVTDERLAATLLDLLARRRPGASLCPSEVARAVEPDDWRPLMPRIRAIAGRLAADGRIRVTQRGADVDPATATGPLRLRAP